MKSVPPRGSGWVRSSRATEVKRTGNLNLANLTDRLKHIGNFAIQFPKVQCEGRQADAPTRYREVVLTSFHYTTVAGDMV